MVKKEGAGKQDPEIAAISSVYLALKTLDSDSQNRVIDYVAKKLNLTRTAPAGEGTEEVETLPAATTPTAPIRRDAEASGDTGGDDLEGISPVAKKWMKRKGLTTTQLSPIFSLGVDEIDLVAKKVPGKNKKKRMRSVLLLKGIAAYLSSGVARFAYEQAKEACLHYDAYDAANFSAHLKSLSSEFSGSKESGYQLTPRGLSNATEIVSEIAQPGKAV